MRCQFSRPRRKRQTRPLTGGKAVQRHAAWRVRKKAGRWLPWVRPISVYALLNSADAEADSPLSLIVPLRQHIEDVGHEDFTLT